LILYHGLDGGNNLTEHPTDKNHIEE